MGDYGFDGAGEFPGQDDNLHTKPDPRKETAKMGEMTVEMKLSSLTERLNHLIESRSCLDNEIQRLGEIQHQLALDFAIESCPYKVGEEIVMPEGAFEHTAGKSAIVREIIRGLQNSESKWGVIAEITIPCPDTGEPWTVPIKWYDVQEGNPLAAKMGNVVLPECSECDCGA